MTESNSSAPEPAPARESRRYFVRWEVEMDAESPQAAAEDALKQMRDPASTATAFTVIDSMSGERRALVVDPDHLFGAARDGALSPAEVFDILCERRGLGLADVTVALAAKRDAYDLAAVKVAKENHEDEGEVEIDDNALTSRDDDESGCYVMAWVWAPKYDMKLDGGEGRG